MPTVPVTDQLQLTASIQISDKSSLALAELRNVNFSHLPIVGDFAKPLDQFTIDQVELGVTLTSPSRLVGDGAKLSVGGGPNATLSIYTPKHKALFGEDDFAPELKISAGECWAGLAISATLQEGLSAAVAGGFGVSLKAGSTVTMSTFVHFPFPGSVIPAFQEGLTKLLENYSVPSTSGNICALRTGVAHSVELSGNVLIGASYGVPVTLNPLASLGKPLNLSLNVNPSVVVSVKGSVTLAGTFIVRTYRSSDTSVVIGLYKKRQTTLSASLNTLAGIGIDLNKADILSKVLDAVVPGANLDDLHLDPGQKQDLSAGLKQCVDQSIALAMNACCTASVSDEAAVVYEIDLAQGVSEQANSAIAAALKGDWSQLKTLSNAIERKHILRDLEERNQKVNINLLGLYNATTITDYVDSTTVLQDEHGQIAIVDKVAAKRLSAGTAPYAARSEKLRSVLAQAFVATITYGACKGNMGVSAFSVQQSFLEYHARASRSDLDGQLRLAKLFGFSLDSDLKTVVHSDSELTHNKFYLETNYDLGSIYRLFYQDVDKRSAYPPGMLERIGRDTKIALLDATDSAERIDALQSDDIWNAMNADGDTGNFGRIPGLTGLKPTAQAAIAADWIDVRWWCDAVGALTPKLSAVLQAVDKSRMVDPTNDPAVVSAHEKLKAALLRLAADTQSGFGDGWPIAVMYRLATSEPDAGLPAVTGPEVEMDISINGISQHQKAGPQLARTRTSSAG
jgi:hypothetical protein